MPTYTARNVVEAILKAEELQAAGEYDLFRGQLSATWDCVPSLFRVPAPMQAMAAEAARCYLLWMGATPGLEEIHADPNLIFAVGQHYGLPTRLLDFTTSPKIAGFFATDGDRSAHAEGAIILLRSNDVAEYTRILPGRVIRVLRPCLDNLWRMTAQRGVFVETEFPSLEYLAMTKRITFPHDESTCGLAREEIYPAQSPLEILLRQYFDNESALQTQRDLEIMFGPDEITPFALHTWEQNPEYFRPDGLAPLDSWRSERIEPWLKVAPEPLAIPDARSLSLPWELPASLFGDSVRDQVRAQLADSQMRTKQIRWRCEIEGTNLGAHDMAEFADLLCAKLGLLWDGLRRLPYDDTVLANGMGLCAAILRGQRGGRSERDVLEELLGPITQIGFGAADGSGAIAYAANTHLHQALRRDLLAHAAPAHRETFGELTKLLHVVGRAGATDHANRGQSRVCAHLLILLYPHVLSGGAWQDRPHPQADGRGAGDEVAIRGTRDPHLPFSGRRLSAVRSRVASVGVRVRRGTAPARSARRGNLEDQLPRRRGRARAVRNFARCRTVPRLHGAGIRKDQGLETLHKQITVEQNIRAVRLLKSIGLMWEYGFMLLDPSSTFASVRENLAFLRTILANGCLPVTFCRMLPYDGTPIKDALVRSGRLLGDICNPDYDFLDPRLSEFYEGLSDVVSLTGWIHGLEAVTQQLGCAWHEVAVIERLFPELPGIGRYKQRLRRITKTSNDLLLNVVEDLSYVYSDGRKNRWDPDELEQSRADVIERLLTTRNRFVLRHQDLLLRSLGVENVPTLTEDAVGLELSA